MKSQAKTDEVVVSKAEQSKIDDEVKAVEQTKAATSQPVLTYDKKAITPAIKAWARAKTGEGKASVKVSTTLIKMVEELAANSSNLDKATKGSLKPLRGYLIDEASKLYEDANSIKATASKVISVARYLVGNKHKTVQAAMVACKGAGSSTVDNLSKAIRKTPEVNAKAGDKKAASGLTGSMSKLTAGEVSGATDDDVTNIKAILANDDNKLIKAIVRMFIKLSPKLRETCIAAMVKAAKPAA